MRTRTVWISNSLALFFLVGTASALTVEEAYNAIPHRQTSYDSRQSTVRPEVADYLAKLFALSDRALVERVSTVQAFTKRDLAVFSGYQTRIDEIRREIESLPEPAEVKGLGAMLSQAIVSQKAYFARWHSALNSGASMPAGIDSNVRAASSALHQLYGALMSRFPEESPHNKDAFFQHLCALDFI